LGRSQASTCGSRRTLTGNLALCAAQPHQIRELNFGQTRNLTGSIPQGLKPKLFFRPSRHD